MATSRASSSLTSSGHHRQWRYQVFLSFRGEDTREGFTGNLYDDLNRKGIITFIDDVELKKGEQISKQLLKTIRESRIAIVVFSKNYAESGWCLDELAHILDCKKQSTEYVVRPVFYAVDPSDVRNVTGVVGEAFAKLKQKLKEKNIYGEKKVNKWIAALKEVGSVSGWHYKNVRYEHEFRHEITNEISEILNKTTMHVADHPVGMNSRLSGLTSLLKVQSKGAVLMVGICGMGGIGKSATARALYNSIVNQFEGKCFIENISANPVEQLVHLQMKIVSQMTGKSSITFDNIHQGIPIIKSTLGHKKVLLILDDVNKREQLQALAGREDWFGPGSRIIVTSKNDHLLRSHGIRRIYNVPYLLYDEALELFETVTSKNCVQDENCADISRRAIAISKCHPLLVETIGYELAGLSVDECRCTLDRYESHPGEEIPDVLHASYNSLPDYVKPIFLDIVCFFRGIPLDDVEKILNACGFDCKMGIRILLDRHFISCQDKILTVHDLMVEIGRESIRKESRKPHERSRLWISNDIHHVLTQQHEELDKIEGIILDSHNGKLRWDGQALGKMKNLRILIVKNVEFISGPECLPPNLRVLHWTEYPSSAFQEFDFENIVLVGLPRSLVTLKVPFKNYEYLSFMDLRRCYYLTEVPDMSRIPNLEKLYLSGCIQLRKIHKSVGFLSKLAVLNASHCPNLSSLPPRIRLPSLELLDLSECQRITEFPDVLEIMNNIRTIEIGGTRISDFPSSFTKLVGVENLRLSKLYWLTSLPSDFYMFEILTELNMGSCNGASKLLNSLNISRQMQMESTGNSLFLPNLASLDLGGCGLGDEVIPILVCLFPQLDRLCLSRNRFMSLLPCLSGFSQLKTLDLSFCHRLREVSTIPPNLTSMNFKGCKSLLSGAVKLLLSQALNEVRRLSIYVTGEEIPEWFDHHFKGNKMSFWVRQHFPICALLLVVQVLDVGIYSHGYVTSSISSTLRINGREVCVHKDNVDDCESYIRLMDLEVAFDLKGRMDQLDAYLKPDIWNHVEISHSSDHGVWLADVIQCGIHMYKIESELKDAFVRFVAPQKHTTLRTSRKQ